MVEQGPAVLIADDHEPTREELRFALEDSGRFVVVGEAADAPSAISEALRLQPDLVLMDINMPGSGIAATWEIHARLPETKVVMLTVSEANADIFGSIRAGAAGYLLKDTDPRSLPRALQAVLDGEVALPRALMTRVIEEFRDRSARRRSLAVETDAPLTSREWQVLDLLRQELSTAEIARRLVLSPVTVRTHVSAIMRKLQVNDREELRRHLDGER